MPSHGRVGLWGKEPLKIAHIDTERTWRGGQQQVCLLIEGLAKLGYTNTAVVRRNSALDRRLAGSIPVKRVRIFTELDFVAAHFVNRWLKSEKVDVVHAHSGHGVALAVLSTLGTSLPVVITRRVDFRLSGHILSRWKYRRAARVVAISEGVRRSLLESGVEADKISVIPSGVDFKKFEMVKAVDRERFGFPSHAVVVGQVAALAPHKDQATFLKSLAFLIKRHADVYAVLVGEGPLRKNLEIQAKNEGLADRVRFLGFQENPLDFLASFDIFCLSSREEGLGTSLLDAMALRVPVVATNTGGIPELIQEGTTGYIAPPGDPEGLAQALERAIEQRSSHQPLLDRAVQKAQSYDIATTVSRIDALYKSLKSH